MTSITDPLTHTTSYTYDDYGNKTSETDALDNTTYYAYDDKGNLASTKNALGVTITDTHNENGQLLTSTISGPGVPQPRTVVRNTYDVSGNLISRTDALGNESYYSYDSKGNFLSATDAHGTVTSRCTYDSQGRFVSTTDANAFTTTYTHDIMGNELSRSATRVIDGQPITITYTKEYDKLGRVIRSVDPENNEAITAIFRGHNTYFLTGESVHDRIRAWLECRE